MIFNSIDFLMFFPLVTLIYFIVPQKFRYIWLLISSYYFYMSWNAKYVIFMVFSTLISWGGAILISNIKSKNIKKITLLSVLLSNMAILFFFKYFDFFMDNVNAVLAYANIKIIDVSFDLLLPIGISFYTFQVISYTVDVYKGKLQPEKNLLKYALFVAFFLKLIAGPIERGQNLLKQISEKHTFNWQQIKSGVMLMLWGYFQKVVIADRIAIAVSNIYDNYSESTGIQIVFATMLYGIQILCDFAGYSEIAVGAGRIMGFSLIKNFEGPYFSKSVAEFWRRWHISLSSWLRDYVYIPLGGSRCSRIRKYYNLLVTFLVSGLWHGSSWNFVIWGGLNGCYQVIGDFTKNFRSKVKELLHIKEGSVVLGFVQTIITFLLVDFAWMFFRVSDFGTGINMIIHSIKNVGLSQISNGMLLLGMDVKEFVVMLVVICILLIMEYIRTKHSVSEVILKQHPILQSMVFYIAIFVVLIFGIYGGEFDASTFIYTQF